jgi:calcium/calmodulin-dependent protein kinase (CaM kinase) II
MVNMTIEQQLVELTQQLLESIAGGDWETYAQLCDPSLSAFEPESRGQLVEGLPFHKYFFDLGRAETPHNTTMCAPHVRMLGSDNAVVSYIRLNQTLDSSGSAKMQCYEETRVWQQQEGEWKHVHFHRSVSA